MSAKVFLVQDNKFWQISKSQEDATYSLLIRYGNFEDDEEKNVKQVKKTFDDEADCNAYMQEAAEVKREKGYKEQQQPSQASSSKTKTNASKAAAKANIKADSIARLTDDALNGRKQPIKGAPVDLGSGKIPKGSVMLAQTWNEDIDPKDYMLSEKLDGMRMIWTGSSMYSRNGNPISFPDFFVKGWPKSYLDGELWLERDQFQKLVSITKRQVPNEDDWRRVKYMVFDAPGLNLKFQQRYERFKAACEQANEYIVYVPHIVCKGYDHLIDELEAVQAKGGEGLMLRDPESKYEQRRSDKLLKVKTFEDDEATVLGHEEGTGRCQGMLGALRVRNTEGVEFRIGSGMDDNLRLHPPRVGSKITYKFYGKSKNGVPRFPIFLRRHDAI